MTACAHSTSITYCCTTLNRFPLSGGYGDHVAGGRPDDCPTSIDDGISAQQAALGAPRGLAFGPDRAIFVAEPNRVRRIGPEGTIYTVAGTAVASPSADPDAFAVDIVGRPGTSPLLARDMDFGDKITDVAVGRQGEVYVSTPESVFVVDRDGVIKLFAGGARAGAEPRVDAFDPIRAPLDVQRMALAPDGSLLLLGESSIRQIQNGALTVVATASGRAYRDGMASEGVLAEATAIAVQPSGRLVVADIGRARTIVLGSQPPSNDVYQVNSSDGRELWTFDRSGKHLRTQDALTGTTLYDFEYGAAGLLTAVRDVVAGTKTVISRDSVGRPTSIQAPDVIKTAISADLAGRMTTMSAALGVEHRFTYHPGTNLLASVTDPNGYVSRFDYDETGRLIQDRDAAGGDQRLVRTETNQGFTVSRFTAATVNPTVYRERQDLDGSATSESQEPDGTVSSTSSAPDGTITGQSADGTRTELILGPDPRWQMNAAIPQSVTVTLPSGLQRHTTSDRSVLLTDPLDATSPVLEWQETTQVGADPAVVTKYDAATRTLTQTSPAGRRSITTFNAAGQAIRIERPGLAPVDLSYFEGRVSTIQSGNWRTGLRTRSYSYRHGLLASSSEPDGDLYFDRRYIPWMPPMVQRNGIPMGLDYDRAGQVTRLRAYYYDSAALSHQMRYTPVGLLSEYIAPSVPDAASSTLRTQYDRDRRIDLQTLPDGRTLDYRFDARTGLLSNIDSPDAQMVFAYDRGKVSRITRVDGLGEHTLSLGYDGMLMTDQVWSSNGSTLGNVRKSYDDHFRLEQVNVGSEVAFDVGYDADNLLTHAGPITVARRADNGLPITQTIGNITIAYAFNEFGEPSSIRARFNGADLYRQEITARSQRGQIESQAETIQGVTTRRRYAYRSTGLSGVSVDSGPWKEYSYDNHGNRHVGAVPDGTRQYDAQDRLLRDATHSYSYNATGQLTTRTKLATGATTRYTYDVHGNLQVVELPDQRRIDYEIDALNRRVGKSVDGTKQFGLLYLDALRPIAQLDADNEIAATFIYASGRNVPDAMVRDGQTYTLLTNHLGSVRLVVNTATGAVMQRIDYDEFGQVLVDTNPGFQPFGFAGGLYDPHTGLVRFGARDYDAVTGRWTAKDPILFGGGQSNLYTYLAGDPLNLTDPYGLGWWYNGSSVPIDVIDEDWKWRRLEPGQSAEIDGFFNPTDTPFEGTTSADAYRKVDNKTDGAIRDVGDGHLKTDMGAKSSLWDTLDPRTGWKDAEWVKKKYVPEKQICE